MFTVGFFHLLRLLAKIEGQNASLVEAKILEKIEGKKYDSFKESSVSWLFTCLLEALKETRPLFFNFTREKSLNSLGVSLRNVRRHLNPNWYCSSCGRQVRWNFKPLVDCVVDPLLDENAGFFAPVRIGCVNCDAFFEQKVEEGFFDV